MIAVFTLGLIAIFSYGMSSVLRAEEMKSYFVEYMAKHNVPQDVITAMVDLLNKKNENKNNHEVSTYDDPYYDYFSVCPEAVPGHHRAFIMYGDD